MCNTSRVWRNDNICLRYICCLALLMIDYHQGWLLDRYFSQHFMGVSLLNQGIFSDRFYYCFMENFCRWKADNACFKSHVTYLTKIILLPKVFDILHFPWLNKYSLLYSLYFLPARLSQRTKQFGGSTFSDWKLSHFLSEKYSLRIGDSYQPKY